MVEKHNVRDDQLTGNGTRFPPQCFRQKPMTLHIFLMDMENELWAVRAVLDD